MSNADANRITSGRCHECGTSHAMQVVVLSGYDASALVGLPVIVDKMRTLRCSHCGAERIEGRDVASLLHQVMDAVIRAPSLLSGERARFLRKQLGLTQQELAERADIDRVTVAKWETGDKPISPQHDFLLRGFAVAELMRAKGAPPDFVASIVAEVLGRVRTASAPAPDEPLHIAHAA
jgi:putative zinc finger/helix-turn-helix YgiT family protein